MPNLTKHMDFTQFSLEHTLKVTAISNCTQS